MADRIFYTSLDEFRITFTKRIPSSVWMFEGPLERGSPAYNTGLRHESAKIFEQLVLFDCLDFRTMGFNVAAPLLRSMIGAREFEALIEQGAIRFTVWDVINTPFSVQDKVVLWGGRMGKPEYRGDFERFLIGGFRYFAEDIREDVKRGLIKKLIPCHSIVPEGLAGESSQLTTQAMTGGLLGDYGFTDEERETGQISKDRAELYVKFADDLASYKYLLQSGLTSFLEHKFFFPFRTSVHKLAECGKALNAYQMMSQVQNIPNLQSIHDELSHPFRELLKLRAMNDTVLFREWLRKTSVEAEPDKIIGAYINAIKKKPGHFEKAPARYVKGILATGLSLFASHLMGDVAVAPFLADAGLDAFTRLLGERVTPSFSPSMFFDNIEAIRANNAT